MIDVYYTLRPPCMVQEDAAAQPASRLVCYRGVPVYVRPYDEQHYQITGLCTTDPAQYLKAELRPGALIPLFR